MNETKPENDARCPACGKKSANECGRIDCANRKRVTADVPGGSTHQSFSTGCSWRVAVRPQE